jgi:large subunit ribosomal protein L21
MATAVIRTGGQQYRVSEGETIRVEKLVGEPGSKVEFSEVLAIAGGDTPKLGKPLVAGAKVAGEIVTQGRGEKLVIFKFKRRKRYRRKNGHRQSFTAVRITSIQG